MIRCLLLLIFINQVAHAVPHGYLWYNLPQESIQKPSISFSKLSFTDKDAVLKFYTLEALHKVRFTHKIEDERIFLAMQDYWLREATIHGKVNQLALLKYPEYDFSVTHPTSQLGTKLQDTIEYQNKIQNIKSLAKLTGLMFFYRGKNPIDRQQIPILLDFCERYKFKLLPISIDGKISELLPNSKIDNGQAKHLNLRYFPAILIVNPKTKEITPVAFGLTTQDVLTERLSVKAHKFAVQQKTLAHEVIKSKFEFFKNHALLYFFKSSCPYCKISSPVIKNWADKNKANVYAYTLDNNVIPEFKNARIPPKELITSAFADNNISTPALFIMNTDTFKIYPAIYGAVNFDELNTRMQNLIEAIQNYEEQSS